MTDDNAWTKEQEFLLEEFKILRKEIEIRLSQADKLLQFSTLGIGGIYAWIEKPGTSLHDLDTIAWWGPVLIAAIGGMQSYGIGNRIAQLGAYIKTIEPLLFTKSKRGWETSDKPPSHLKLSFSLAWLSMLAITMAIALAITWPCIFRL